MKYTEINWKSSKEEISNMTIKQAIEILENQIELGYTKGDFRPREHMVKALEIAVKCMKSFVEDMKDVVDCYRENPEDYE